MSVLRLLVALCVAATALIAGNTLLAGSSIDISPVHAPPNPVRSNTNNTEPPEGLHPERAAYLETMLSRPLFMESRRPFVKPRPILKPTQTARQPAKPTKTKPTQAKSEALAAVNGGKKLEKIKVKKVPKPPVVFLHGILLNQSSKKALISTAYSPEPSWIDNLSKIEGWEMSILDDNRVKFFIDDHIFEVKLYVDNGDKK